MHNVWIINSCIRVRSPMNDWMDAIILTSGEDVERAKDVVSEAYDRWVEPKTEDIETVPWGEYIKMCLDEACIQSDIFYAPL